MGFFKGALFLLFFCTSLFSEFQMQHTLLFQIEPLNQIGQFLGPAPVFQCSGKNLEPCIHNTYSVATNGVNKKMSAFLDMDMPKGTSFWVMLAPPKNARTMGFQPLSVTPVDLVIEISEVAESELALEYMFKVTPEAGIISGTTRIVFYTLTDG
jgi:hypothetical protein